MCLQLSALLHYQIFWIGKFCNCENVKQLLVHFDNQYVVQQLPWQLVNVGYMKFATLLFGEYKSGLRTGKFKEQTNGVVWWRECLVWRKMWIDCDSESVWTVWWGIIHWIWNRVIQFKGHFIIYKRLVFVYLSLKIKAFYFWLRCPWCQKYKNHFCIIREMHNTTNSRFWLPWTQHYLDVL